MKLIDEERLWKSVDAAAAVGALGNGGVRRLALSDADRQMRALFRNWCEKADLDVTFDRIGNLFARRAGTEELSPVMIGSHLDSQVAGGRYDGVLGVLAGLEVVRCLNDHAVQTRRPIVVATWTNEEGARFTPPLMGAAVYTGAMGIDEALARTDEDDLSVEAELQRIGYAGHAAVPGPVPFAYLEFHIEQDDHLDASGVNLGIVVDSFRSRGAVIRICGETAHPGATPMERRHDALAGGASLAVAVESAAKRIDGARATTTRLAAWPNRPGIVAGSATLTIDYRHHDQVAIDQMTDDIELAIGELSSKRGLGVSVLSSWAFGGDIRFDPRLAHIARRCANACDVQTTDMVSTAGHDAYRIADIAPTLIMFAPCVGGITHNVAEEIDRERVGPAVEVLAQCALDLADLVDLPAANPTVEMMP